MEDHFKVSCDWGKCSANAANRVDFADRVFSSADARFAPVEHRNLCAFHTGEIRRTHMEFYERPLAIADTRAGTISGGYMAVDVDHLGSIESNEIGG